MGNAQCGSAVRAMEDQLTKEINKQLEKDRLFRQHSCAALLLGGHSVGKSTLAKQIHRRYLEGWMHNTRVSFKRIIQENYFRLAKTIVNAHKYCTDTNFSATAAASSDLPDDLKLEVQQVNGMRTNLDTGWARKLVCVFTSDTAAVARRYLQGSSQYGDLWPPNADFWMEPERVIMLADDRYLPSDEEILRCRTKTTGICEIEFFCHDQLFRLVDVSGPRSERKRWIHVFSDMAAIVFLVSFERIGRHLFGDRCADAWDEQAALLREVLVCKFWLDTPVIIVATHFDRLPSSRCAAQLLQQLLNSATDNCDDDVLAGRLRTRAGPVHIIADAILVRCDKHVDQRLETLLQLISPNLQHPAAVPVPMRVDRLSACSVTLHRHPTPEQRAVCTMGCIHAFRPDSGVARLPKQVLLKIQSFCVTAKVQ